jgi:Tol biopolymer transport system component
MLRRIARLVLFTGALAAGFACGGGGDKPDGGGTASSAQAPAPTVAKGVQGGLLLSRDQRLFLRDMKSGQESVIGRAPASAFYQYPRWSPDGKQIAYVMAIQFNGAPNQDWGSDVGISAPDGSDAKVIFKHPAPGTTVEGLDWSADGQSLYLGILETRIENGKLLGQTSRLEKLDLATGARTPLVPEANYPAVAPDGSAIAYITYGTPDAEGGIWVARPDGTSPRLVVPMNAKVLGVMGATFSPDSKTLAYSAITAAGSAEQWSAPRQAFRWPWQPKPAAAHGLPMDVWSVSVAGGEPKRLTNFAEDEPFPAWSPDGTEIAVMATGGLYVLPATGGEPRKVGLGVSQGQIDWR